MRDLQKDQGIYESNEEYFRWHDPLTRIWNRDYFHIKVEERLKNDLSQEYQLIVTNIESFKAVNELFGSQIGDKVLLCFVDCLRNTFKDQGLYARLWGDEFAVCFPKDLISCMDLCRLFEHAFDSLKLDYEIKVYLGVYVIKDRSVPVELICDRANLALQQIKGNALQHYLVYNHSFRVEFLQEQRLMSELDGALENKQFEVYVQPIFSISKNCPVSAEALVRWNHKEMGMIAPSRFIPILERNGAIAKLDRYVKECACCYLSDLKQSGFPDFPISVNVSRVNFFNPKLYVHILELTKKYDISSKNLRLELTEGVYVNNTTQLKDAISRLQDYGFTVMMDDFGTGYSSLNMLKDMPFDYLKIDMSFIRDLQKSSRVGIVMSHIVHMAKWLNMMVIAEGVEKQGEINYLKSIGCDLVQGYYYAKPMPYKEFKQLLQTYGPKESEALRKSDIVPLETYDYIWCSGFDRINQYGIVDSIGVYNFENGRLSALRVNQKTCDLFGVPVDHMIQNMKNLFLYIKPDDRGKLTESIKCSRITKHQQKCVVDAFDINGKPLCLYIKIRFIGIKNLSEIYFVSFEEISNLLKENKVVSAEQIKEEDERIQKEFDPITGFYSKYGLNMILKQKYEQKSTDLMLILLKICNMQQIMMQYGKFAADTIIKRISIAIKENLLDMIASGRVNDNVIGIIYDSHIEQSSIEKRILCIRSEMEALSNELRWELVAEIHMESVEINSEPALEIDELCSQNHLISTTK